MPQLPNFKLEHGNALLLVQGTSPEERQNAKGRGQGQRQGQRRGKGKLRPDAFLTNAELLERRAERQRRRLGYQ